MLETLAFGNLFAVAWSVAAMQPALVTAGAQAALRLLVAGLLGDWLLRQNSSSAAL